MIGSPPGRSVTQSPTNRLESAGIVGAPQLRQAPANHATRPHPRRCLKIVVSPVRVRVSPSPESAANRRFLNLVSFPTTTARVPAPRFVAKTIAPRRPEAVMTLARRLPHHAPSVTLQKLRALGELCARRAPAVCASDPPRWSCATGVGPDDHHQAGIDRSGLSGSSQSLIRPPPARPSTRTGATSRSYG